MLQQYDARNKDILVNIDGELVHRDKAGISPFDSSVQNGDAVWEGLRVYQGRIFRLHRHLDRLYSSAEALAYEGMPAREDLIRELQRTLDANAMHDGVHIRLSLSRGRKYTSGMDPRLNVDGCTFIIIAEFKAPVYNHAGISLVTAKTRRIPEQCLDQKIHSANQLNSILAKIEANKAGADDALMLDIDGFVAETNATHIFVVTDGVLRTSDTRACPEGVTRATVLALCNQHEIPAVVERIPLADVYPAQEVFCTGTMGELVAVVAVDGQVIGDGKPGPLTRRLSELYNEVVRLDGDALV